MKFEIIDFHTHPFETSEQNICKYKENCNMSIDNTVSTLQNLGITTICGSVVSTQPKRDNESEWDKVKRLNDSALNLKMRYGKFYVPGFHVHPDFLEESIKEIDRMASLGVNLIGELVPYLNGWKSYDTENLHTIIDYATEKGMLVSLHTSNSDDMDRFVSAHPDTIIVGAHPDEYPTLIRHIERMKKHKNYYLDLSGTGLFRYGMLRKTIDEVGAKRILFGTDYPTCSPAMQVGALLLDELITDEERELILSKNAKRLLNIK